ncbi:MAG: thioredoxin family protein [Gammaproteobacteria bacterium]|nr:thioredoxin family protein [Gammaproteobacteria bacterium]
MARTPSTMLELGTVAPNFDLLQPVTGERISLNAFLQRPLLVAFICNHCPFVIHIAPKLAEVAARYPEVAFVAINSNDATTYPDDAPEKMGAFMEKYGFTFPYLYDETQQVAQAYRAACTPDFYLFSADHHLVYRGQFDSARPGNGLPVNGEDLVAALDALRSGSAISEAQIPSLGCNIKWRAGSEPDYFHQ